MQNLKILTIPDVIIKKTQRFSDHRGWLMECFRSDETSKELMPEMAYISVTLPGMVRGPHEHLYQTDCFCFVGTSAFQVYLWDNRKDSAAYKEKMIIQADENSQFIMIVPPGVVHAYKNIGDKDGIVLNFPNKLYGGICKKYPVDEIRHENKHNSLFKIEDLVDLKAD